VTLDLLKRSLCGMETRDPPRPVPWDTGIFYDEDKRYRGVDWPLTAWTMIGLARLNHLESCVEQVLDDDVPGDLLEAGVWRGGACVLMRAILASRGVTDRVVWAADSFAGFPPGDALAEGLAGSEQSYLAVSLEEVQRNFASCGLLDDQVRFLPGYFADTLPGPVEKLAVLRLDGDMHSSTRTVLDCLYPKVSRGGFVIVDDWSLEGCRTAVLEYRTDHAIRAPLAPVPDCQHEDKPVAVYWRLP
jgi:hypothetical protein